VTNPLRVSCWPELLLAGCLAAGCTSEQIYNSAQGWRRSECYKLVDLAQRERCLKEADRPYDAYRVATPPSR
jgi:hypothetical protein